MVLVADEEIVKVHVHTNDPGLAIQKALTFGALTRMKIDNMREEHHEKSYKKRGEAGEGAGAAPGGGDALEGSGLYLGFCGRRIQ